VGGTLEQLADKDDPCEGAVPREHSHFFTEFGTFDSLDWRREEVDENTYELVDNRTFTIGDGDGDGDGDAMFHFEIQGGTIRFEPILPDQCTRFDRVWMVAVAFPGHTWDRVSWPPTRSHAVASRRRRSAVVSENACLVGGRRIT
jgi:hypothetical protein